MKTSPFKNMIRRELVSVYADWTDVADELGATSREFRLASARVINEMLRKARAQTTRELADRLKVQPSRLIRRRLRIDRATSKRPSGTIRILTNPISVIRLRGVRQVRRKGGGVTVPGHASYLGAFITRKRGTVTDQVFRRRGDDRYPIDVIKVEMAREAELVMTRIVDDLEQDSVARLRKELVYRLSLRKPGSDGLRMAA